MWTSGSMQKIHREPDAGERERERYIVDCRAQSRRAVSKLLQKDRCFIGNCYTSDRESCSLLSVACATRMSFLLGKEVMWVGLIREASSIGYSGGSRYALEPSA